MNILLINTNPVVSRLLVLCTRDNAITLNEASSVDEVRGDSYDMVFVDESSYGRDVATLINKFYDTKKVFISYRNDDMRGFDETIKKPFLPSQIIELIQGVISTVEALPSLECLEEMKEEGKEENIEETVKLPNILDSDELERIKSLLDMNEQIETVEEVLSDEEIEVRKIALIKEQLIADGLEIVEANEVIEELSVNLDGTFRKKDKVKKDKVKKEKNKKKIKSKKSKFSDKNMKTIDDAVRRCVLEMTKKQMKQLHKGKEIEICVKLKEEN